MRKKKKLCFGSFHLELKVLLLIGFGEISIGWVECTDSDPLMLMTGLILLLTNGNKDPIRMSRIILLKHPKRHKFSDVWLSFVDKLVIALKWISKNICLG